MARWLVSPRFFFSVFNFSTFLCRPVVFIVPILQPVGRLRFVVYTYKGWWISWRWFAWKFLLEIKARSRNKWKMKTEPEITHNELSDSSVFKLFNNRNCGLLRQSMVCLVVLRLPNFWVVFLALFWTSNGPILRVHTLF